MRRASTTRAACGLILALAGLLGPSAARAAVSPEIAAARLQGNYAVSGVVTQAVGVAGEHRGQQVQRTWSFISPCATGACPVLGLHRQRESGTDPLFLRQVSPGRYTGAGIFAAPVRCHGRPYRQGSVVPYTITLTITTAAPQPDGSILATGFSAAYRNRGRIGHTRCYSPPSYDSARYLGVPVAPVPPIPPVPPGS
ncbi:MAG: hypothetical protein M3Y09_08690 [Actinomycetota bacterium]|nr:hypothetical protein [Actinomycetota bacterium]